MRRRRRGTSPAVPAASACFLLLALAAAAAPGDVLRTLDVSFVPLGFSLAVDCEGTIYVSGQRDYVLYRLDRDGYVLSTRLLPFPVGEISWDESRRELWVEWSSSGCGTPVYRVDPATGDATYLMDYSNPSCCASQKTSISWDSCDDTFWIKDDTCRFTDHFTSAGSFLSRIEVQDARGETRVSARAQAAAGGKLLYVAHHQEPEVYRASKRDGSFLSLLATLPPDPTGAKFGGVECDPVNFAPKVALWVRRQFTLWAIEADAGACWCGAEPAPADRGNTLMAARLADDVVLGWAEDIVASSYTLHRGTEKGVWPSPSFLPGLLVPAATLPDVPAPPALYFYRAAGVSCTGLQGP